MPAKILTIFFNYLEDKHPIGRFLLALAKSPLSPLSKMVTNDVSQEGPSGICVLSDLCILDVMNWLICVFDLEQK